MNSTVSPFRLATRCLPLASARWPRAQPSSKPWSFQPCHGCQPTKPCKRLLHDNLSNVAGATHRILPRRQLGILAGLKLHDASGGGVERSGIDKKNSMPAFADSATQYDARIIVTEKTQNNRAQ